MMWQLLISMIATLFEVFDLVRSKLQAWKLYNGAQGKEVGLGTRMDVTHVKERNDGDDDVDDDEMPFRQVEQELEVIGLGSE